MIKPEIQRKFQRTEVIAFQRKVVTVKLAKKKVTRSFKEVKQGV